MKINLEILDASYIYNEIEVENLKTKEIVPKMILRRRLTKASKLVLELMNNVNFQHGRIVYGTGYGEVLATANILKAILNKDHVSPTDFQNSVYNTAVSYASIMAKNKSEILTISSGDKTSAKVLKVGAVKALDLDEILLISLETMNIENIEEINKCNNYLECAVLLKVKVTTEDSNFVYSKDLKDLNLPSSVQDMFLIAKNYSKKNNIVEVNL